MASTPFAVKGYGFTENINAVRWRISISPNTTPTMFTFSISLGAVGGQFIGKFC